MKSGRRVIDGKSEKTFPISPWLINTDTHFMDAFGNTETEISARWIVRLCQERGNWLPFTLPEIENFYRCNSRYTGFTFNRLVNPEKVMRRDRGLQGEPMEYETLEGGGWIVKKGDWFFITREFVLACLKSAPNF